MRPWTREEDERLCLLAGMGATLDEAEDSFALQRTRGSIRQRARRLKLRFTRRPTAPFAWRRTISGWTAEQDETLRRMAPTHLPQEVAQAVGKAVYSVHRRAARLRVRFERMLVGRHRPWTAKELEILKWHVGHRSMAWLCARLGRTYSAVKCKAEQLGLSRLQGKLTVSGAARELGVQRKTVARHRDALGLGALALEDLPAIARSILAGNYDAGSRARVARLREIATEEASV